MGKRSFSTTNDNGNNNNMDSKYIKLSTLNKDETERYSRQMLCPELGKSGQLRLKSSSVLVVGAGGLGCPASLYMTAAGIGRIGFVDSDSVDRSNLHRQILHSESTIGKAKTDSAVERLQQLNSNVKFDKHQVRLSAKNALDIINDYDIVIDGTDNPMSRYLLSDVCVLLKKPLISGSALKFEGQLTVYNYDQQTPCYRCLFPDPPKPGTVTNCADGGVIGVVPGIIGNLQALEAIKIASGLQPSYAGTLLLFDGLTGRFRSVELRKKKKDCISCGDNPTITKDLIDYESFCGIKCDSAKPPVKILEPDERITVQEYDEILKSKIKHILIDVRPQLQQDIIKLQNAHSIPLAEIVKGDGMIRIEKLIEETFNDADDEQKSKKKIIVMCRRGNASQTAVREMKKYFSVASKEPLEIKDIIGGIEKWAKEIDPEMPMY